MSSIKTTQLHELTPEKLIGSFSEDELVGLILSLKDTVLNQRRDLARVQRQYEEKKMQYEAVRDRLEWLSNGNHIYRIDEQPEQWWMVEYNMKDQAFTYAKPSTATLTGSILSIDHTLDRLLWRNTARDMDDAREKAVAAWEQAFGVEVGL